MKKFENVDIVDSLRRIMNSNTKQYKSDFIHDIDKIKASALSGNADDKYLLFMSRPSGTWCVRERDAFMKDTPAYSIWNFYGEQTRDKILAYAVKVTGIENGTVKGNLYELDYQAHFKHVRAAAVQAGADLITYQHGSTPVPANSDFPRNHPYYGEFVKSERIPVSLEELEYVLRQEHKRYENMELGNIDTHLGKPSIREQLADGKAKSAKQPKKDKLQKKEDISL